MPNPSMGMNFPMDMNMSMDMMNRPMDNMNRPMDIGNRPMDIGNRPMDINMPMDSMNRPIDIGNRPMDMNMPMDNMNRPLDSVFSQLQRPPMSGMMSSGPVSTPLSNPTAQRQQGLQVWHLKYQNLPFISPPVW
jgi:hypothetical protein